MNKVKKQNISAHMANCKLIHESAPGSLWARHVMLPAHPARDSLFSCTSRNTSISAHVSKAKQRERGQDVAMVITSGEQNVVGVFDGYGQLGDDLPSELAYTMCMLWQLRRDTIDSCQAAEAFIHDAAMLALRRIRECYQVEEPDREGRTPTLVPRGDLPYGGTTAMLAFMFPDGRFLASCVGDSACYVVRPDEGAERYFTYNTIPSRDWRSEYPIPSVDVCVQDYVSLRNVLVYSVTGIRVDRVETMEGRLEKGDMLILASDGVTKNLSIETDEMGKVREVGGCRDIEDIAGKSKGAKKAAGTIMKAIQKRAGFTPGDEKPIGMPGNRVLLPADDDVSLVVVYRRA